MSGDSPRNGGWPYVPCAVEGCSFAFERLTHLEQVAEGILNKRADVVLTTCQGIPQPITLRMAENFVWCPGACVTSPPLHRNRHHHQFRQPTLSREMRALTRLGSGARIRKVAGRS